MNLINSLYYIIVEPLKLILEVVFSVGCYVTGNAGLGIVFLSLVMNTLLLPLYKKADSLQSKEMTIQKKMKPDIDFIKKTFSGNEQFYLLQTYYRQHNYKPIYSLRSSVSIALQIPFFMAAYDFISNLQGLNGLQFGPINDLGKPDGLLFGLNLLPISMTIINIISTIVYTKGQPLKKNIQLYIMALLFLALLYNTPSALSLYYLLNNVFSLIKNIVSKIKLNIRTVSSISFLSSLFCLILVLKMSELSTVTKLMVIVLLIFMNIFSLYCFITKEIPKLNLDALQFNKYSFAFGTIFICLFTGLFIPSTVVSSSTEEFIDRTTFLNPNSYVLKSFLLSLGMFALWFNVYYSLMTKNIKKLLNIAIWIVCGIIVVDYLFFGSNFGTMTNLLEYHKPPIIELKDLLINSITVLVLSALLLFIWYRYNSSIRLFEIIGSLAVLIISIINVSRINKVYNEAIDRIKNNALEGQIFQFSKEKENVVVFMLDRAISTYFPYILNEKPELQEQFEGFTFYPNTISFGGFTNTGTPGLFGGYEYTPEEINKRKDELLVDKQNEALKVLPVLFDNNDFNVVVCDPPYAGYTWVPDLSIYDDYPNIKTYMTEGSIEERFIVSLDKLNRNLFCYSIAKCVPLSFFNFTYNDGNYLSSDFVLGITTDESAISTFTYSFQVLEHLNDLTYIGSDNGLFLMIQNSSTHEPVILQEPEYLPKIIVDNNDYVENDKHKKSITGEELQINTEYQLKHYHANMASMIQLGKWFDYLKKNKVYDNTRIIIVSDHGRDLGLREGLKIYEDDMMMYNALLLVKDFDSHELTIDDSFMTVADVPYLSTLRVIDKPFNVFTGNQITETKKDNTDFNVFGTKINDTSVNNGKQFIKDKWYSVHDDCLNPDNWKIIDEPGS